jgi:tRNA nucleotidyltransferase/poly(A) polymerase
MADSKLLFSIFPELSSLKGHAQNAHHTRDVFDHTLYAFYHLEILLNNLEEMLPEHAGFIRRTIRSDTEALLKCAMLFHDIGKPLTRTENGKGRIHFYGHDLKGANGAKTVFQRLRFSNREIRFIEFVLKHHLRPLLLYQAYRKNTLTLKGITRFFMKCGDQAPAIMLHALADQKGKETVFYTAFERFIIMLFSKLFSDFERKQSIPQLITGRDLIQEFGMKPSPQFRIILSRVEEAKLAGKISNRSEALLLVKGILAKMSEK